MAILLPRSWGRQKPPAGTPLARGNPLRAGLINFLPVAEGAGAPYDLAAGAAATVSGSPAWSATPSGRAIRVTSGVTITAPYRGGLGDVDYTIRMVHRPASWVGGYTPLFEKGTSSSGEVSIYVGVSGDLSYNAFGALSIPTGMTTGSVWDFVVTKSGTVLSYYVNGRIKGTSSGTAFTPNLSGLAVGTNGTGGTAPYDGDLIALQVWRSRALSASEVAALAADPYALFAPPGGVARFAGMGASAAAAYTLAASAGSFALTGQAATLKVGRKLAASVGTFAETGQAAALKVGRRLAASVGTFSEAGNAANLLVARKVTAAPGSFAETGQAASLRVTRTLACAAGVFAETGQAAGLKVAHVLPAAAGPFVLAGQSATLTKTTVGAYMLTASAGSFALAGQPAGLRATRRITAAAGSFALTGSAAGLRVAHVLTAGPGSFSETGLAAGLKAARTLGASAGAYTLTGRAATLTKTTPGAFVLTASAGAFAETGRPATLLAARRLTAAAGSFALTGQSATLTYVAIVAPVATIPPALLLRLRRRRMAGAAVVPPSSLLRAIIDRFRATPELVTAVPGGLLPGIPPGNTPLPWATIVDVGAVPRGEAAGAGGASIWEHRFQISVTALTEARAAEVMELFFATFNYKMADPIVWSGGKAVQVTPINAHLSPEPELTKGNQMVRQMIFTLSAIAVRSY